VEAQFAPTLRCIGAAAAEHGYTVRAEIPAWNPALGMAAMVAQTRSVVDRAAPRLPALECTGDAVLCSNLTASSARWVR
jgi:hypothetical protein